MGWTYQPEESNASLTMYEYSVDKKWHTRSTLCNRIFSRFYLGQTVSSMECLTLVIVTAIVTLMLSPKISTYIHINKYYE